MDKTLYVYVQTAGEDFLQKKFPEINPDARGTFSADYKTLEAMRRMNLAAEQSQTPSFDLPKVHSIYQVSLSADEAARIENSMRTKPGLLPCAEGLRVSGYPVVGEDTIISRDYFKGQSIPFSERTAQDIASHERCVREMEVRATPIQAMNEMLKNATARTSGYWSARVDLASAKMSASINECFHPNGLCLREVPLTLKPLQEAARYVACNGDLHAISHVSKLRDDYMEALKTFKQKNSEITVNEVSMRALKHAAEECSKSCSPNLGAQRVFSDLAMMANQKIPEAIHMDMLVTQQYTEQISQYLQSYGQYLTPDMQKDFAGKVLAKIQNDALSQIDAQSQTNVLTAIKETSKQLAHEYRDDGNHKAAFCYNNISNAAEEAEKAIAEEGKQEHPFVEPSEDEVELSE